VIAALAAASLAVVGAAHASVPAKASGGGRALAVSVPAQPVPVVAGGRVRILIRVVNPNPAAVPVLIRNRSLSFGDDGRVAIGGEPDPRWAGRAGFPQGVVTIPANGFRDIRLAVRVPRALRPDLYFIGFLVTPVPTRSGSIQVINQIGSFLTLDVPGPRDRILVGHFHLPSFVLGSHAKGTVRLRNAGAAAVSFWGESDTVSAPGGTGQQNRLEPSLLPAGRARSIVVSGKPRWPIGMVTVSTRITYPGRTEAETRQLLFTRRVLVVSPWALAAAGGVLLFLVVALIVWRRRRRKRRAARAEPIWPVWQEG
jgi:hypothetical protein